MSNELLRDLISEDESVREDARAELVANMDDDTAAAFLKIAEGDASPEVRADVILGLGPIIEECGDEMLASGDLEDGFAPLSTARYKDLQTRLRKLYDDASQPAIVRRRALESLVRDQQPWMDDEAKKLAASGERDWKLTSLFVMGHLSGFDDVILEELNGSDPELVAEAVHAAGRRAIEGAAEKIADFAASDEADHDVRVSAILALPYLDEDCGDLLEELARDDDDEISEAAGAALDDLRMLQMEDAFDEEE